MGIVSRHKPVDAKTEREIITNMIMRTDYLRGVSQIYTPSSLSLKYSKYVADWCVEFYRAYGEAPGRAMSSIFRHKTKANFPDEVRLDIEAFLSDISEEFVGVQENSNKQAFNLEYNLKKAEEYFSYVSMDNLRVELSRLLAVGDVLKCEILLKTYKRPAIEQIGACDLIRDEAAVIDAFSEDSGSKMLVCPGALGQVIGDLERGNLLTFVGNAGIGKSWWLMQLKMWFILSGYNVFGVSFEMHKRQSTRRTHQWINGLPKTDRLVQLPRWDCYKNQINECKKGKRACGIPISSTVNERLSELTRRYRKKAATMKVVVPPSEYSEGYVPCCICKDEKGIERKDYDPVVFFELEQRNGLTLDVALKKQKTINKYGKHLGKFRYITFPAKQKGISDIDDHLKGLEEYEGFIPDVVITDYAAKMKPSHSYDQFRHGINDIYVEHKGFALDRNIFVATAHQGNTVRDDKDLNRGSWQEGLAGLNESDKVVLVNQARHERKSGFYRMTMGKERDDEFDDSAMVYVLQCLSIGRPYIDSWKF